MKIEYTDINFRNETINGVLYLPNKNKPAPLVIHLNGMPGLEPETEGERFAKELNHFGIAYYAFDYTGVRNSSGIFEYYYSQENINKIISYLVHHPKVLPNKIALLGESFGGAMALCHAVRDSRVQCLAIRSPVYDTKQIPNLKIFDGLSLMWKQSKLMRFPEVNLKTFFKKQSSHYNPTKLISQLKCPVRMITGTKDEILDAKEIEKWFKKLPGDLDKDLQIIENADHNFSNKVHFQKMKNYVIDFFKQQLIS